MPFQNAKAVRLALVIAAVALATPSWADIPVKIYGQELVDRIVAKHPDLLVVVMHVTPPKSDRNVVIASNIGRIGKPGDEDDLRVIETGRPNLEVAHGGARYEVELVMRDVAGETLGALGLVWPYAAGQDPAPFERKAEAICDALAKRILNAANLMDPYPFERLATTRTNAQKLVDEIQDTHPEVRVLAMRAPAAGSPDLVVLGSTFGRHGKKADADDMKIFGASKPVTGTYSNGKRFGVDLQLRDASGRTIGTLNVGYAHPAGSDEANLLAKAERLRDDLAKRIPSAATLGELDP
jgi:hypothetical protein